MDQRALELLKSTWPVLRFAMDVANWKEENPADAQAFLLGQLSELEEEWKKMGVTTGEAISARYALCAFLDETILARSKFGLNWFSHSLVMKHFQDFAAGESFFVKMVELQASRSIVLPVYLLCLISGFKGKYQFGDQKEFSAMIEELREQCASILGSAQELKLYLEEGPGKLPRERSGKGWMIAAMLIGILSVSVYFVLMMQAQS